MSSSTRLSRLLAESRNLGEAGNVNVMQNSGDAAKSASKLEAIANKLFKARAEMREAEEMLHKMYDDSSGDILPDAYAHPRIKEARDQIRDADNAMGLAARSCEWVALVLKGKRSLK